MIKQLKYILFTSITILSLASCLKEDKDIPKLSKVDPVIEFPMGGPGVVAHTIAATPTTILDTVIALNIASPEVLNNDVTVTVVEDPAIITAYNTEHGTSYAPAPSNAYTIESKSITIKAGYRVGRIKVKIDFTKFTDFSKQYAFALKITDAPGMIISGNFGKFLQTLVVKNQYDGVYSYVSGLVTRYTAPGVPAGDALSGPLGPSNPNVNIATTGANTVLITGLTWSGGASAVGGIDGLTATIDPTTNAVTMSATGNATLTNWAGHVNKYDPTDKTFTLNFRWNPATTPREYTVVLKYKGPR